MSDHCFDCEAGGPFHTHHVVPRVYGGSKTVLLCEECHAKAHHRSKAMTTSATTRAGLAAKIAKGELPGGCVPFGYQSPDGVRMEPCSEEREIIQLAKSLLRKGASLRETSRFLAKRGHLSRAGTAFAPTQIARMRDFAPYPEKERNTEPERERNTEGAGPEVERRPIFRMFRKPAADPTGR